MKLKLLAAAAMVVVGTSSFAAGSLGVLDEDGANFGGGTAVPGVFFDSWTFSLASLSDVIGGGFYSPKLLGVGVELFKGGVDTGWGDADIKDGFSFAGLTSGDYTLVFAGFSTGKGTFGGNVYATPVPEPETYAMMLAGLGALGFLARRRKNG